MAATLPLLTLMALCQSADDAHLDVLPGICPNTLDVSLEEAPPGQSRMTVLGNKFDVTQVEVGTVQLGRETVGPSVGGPVLVSPVNIDFIDTSSPLPDARPCECAPPGPDGILDLELTFTRSELVAALGLDLEQDGATVGLVVTGLLNTDGGQEVFFARGDCVLVDNPVQPVQAFCAGDTTAGACPCLNDGLPGKGCDNAQATGGVRLSAVQFDPQASVAELLGEGFPDKLTPAVVLIRSTGHENSGLGTVFGDGLLCLAAPVQRVRAALAVGGVVSFDTIAQNTTRHYQLWYRNAPKAFCSSEYAFNLSNGLTLPWSPGT